MTVSRPIDPWGDFRRQMPVTGHWAYLDHAAVAPLTGPAQGEIEAWAADSAVHGDVHWADWAGRVQRVRALGARLLNASEDEIALVRNTSEGIGLVAEGFPWRSGDNVVVPASEFPSNLYPWMNLAGRGVEVRLIDGDQGCIDLNRLESACDERTRMIAVSWVGYATGWRIDLDAVASLAHRRGALLFVDVIQGLGAFPLDVAQTPIDFCAADGHKWLLGPEGAGLLYVRRTHLELLRPIGVGWNSVRHAGRFDDISFDLKTTAARYEGGTYPVAGFLGLGASLEVLLNHGLEAIGNRILETTALAARRLHGLGALVIGPTLDAERSGIVAFDLPGRRPNEVRKHCLDRGVALACRGGRLRISPHAYNDESDIDRLIDALASL
jgi:cysteine desulfurase/selenocysteine lyase